MTSSIDERVIALGKASRRAAFVSLLGFLLVLGTMVYTATQLAKLQRRQTNLLAQMDKDRKALDELRSELAKARQAVAASRAAINAFHAGRLEDAVALYDEALRADPANAYLQNLRAYALFRLGRIDEALEAQRRSLAIDPQYAWGYYDLARFLCAASPHRLKEAKQAADKALALSGDHRGDLLRTMKQDGEFQRVCRRQIP